MNNKITIELFQDDSRKIIGSAENIIWGGDKDSWEWKCGVSQCYPVCEIVPYGDRSSKQKITEVIAKLMDSSLYFVLEECSIKSDECAFVGSKTSYLAVWQLIGFLTFQGKKYVKLKCANKKQQEWVEKGEYIQQRP